MSKAPPTGKSDKKPAAIVSTGWFAGSLCLVSFQYQRDCPAALSPRAGEFAVFKFSVVGSVDGIPFQAQIGGNKLDVVGGNFGSSLIETDQRAGKCSFRQFGDIKGQREFCPVGFQSPFPVTRQVIRAGM